MKHRHFAITISVSVGLFAILALVGWLDCPGATVTAEPVVGSQATGGAASSPLHYVTITGTDSGDCSTPYSACLTIQYAVDRAGVGDAVLVASGVYTGVRPRPRADITSTGSVTQLVYISKTVAIRGGYTVTNWTTPDPSRYPTTLDAGGRGRVFYVTGEVSPTIEGLRITGGDASGLGGGPSWGPDVGGGLFVETARVTIAHNYIFSNTAMAGGGLRLNSSDATINDNTIAFNVAEQWGGGVDLYASDARLKGNTIKANKAATWGGGLSLTLGQPVFSGNVLVSNTAGFGGGLSLYLGAPTLINNVINFNRVYTSGAGLYVAGSAPSFLHTTLAYNGGGDGSAALFTKYPNGPPSSAVFSNTLLVSHSVGISVSGGNTVTVNGVLWHNTPLTVSHAATASVIVRQQVWGTPAFGPDGYHILPFSAALDAGVDTGVGADIDGQHRPYGGAPDLGADEIVATLIHSDTTATLVYTGTTGTTAAIQVLSGTVTRTTALLFTPLSTTTAPGTLRFGGYAFDLDAYQEGELVPSLHLNPPATITIRYSAEDVAWLDENTLALYYWDGGEWVDASATCDPLSRYDRHPDDNWFALSICHLSRFSLFGSRARYDVYLPLVDAGAVVVDEPDEPTPAAGFVRWRGADGGFDDWGRDGVHLAADGTLQLDPATAGTASDPYGPGGYYGHDFYNGGSFWVGEALSPETLTAFSFEQAIASWNADTPPGTWIETLVRAQRDDRWTKWYNMGVWASDDSTVERHSVDLQGDGDGYVNVDTLVLTEDVDPVNAFQLKLRLFSADGTAVPTVWGASLAFSRTLVPTGALVPGDPGRWDRILEVPECSQMVYPDGGSVWCSPTSVAMVLGYWAGDDEPCEPRVRAAVAGVYDWLYDGHGNWPFNTAYAATQDMEAYVARLESLAQAEEWIAAGVPVIFSLAWGAGELTGAPLSWSYGHLLVLAGFDADGDPVVNDPAAPSDATVQRTYIREEFESLWLEHTNGTVYLIYPPGWPVPDLP